MFQRKRWGGVGKVPRGFVCSFLLLIFVAASLLFRCLRAERGRRVWTGWRRMRTTGIWIIFPTTSSRLTPAGGWLGGVVYDITWQVIDGDQTDYLSWVKIGLPNAYAEDLTPLTDTISDLQYTGDGGSYAKVVFARRYYSPGGRPKTAAKARCGSRSRCIRTTCFP